MSIESERESREVGGTENSWCRAVPGGTGITVLALLTRKPPNLGSLEAGIHTLQKRHPILRSALRRDPASQNFSFVVPDSPSLRIQIITGGGDATFQDIVEQEINDNPWEAEAEAELSDVLRARVHELEGPRWVVVLKAHTAACDRAAAVGLLRELLEIERRGGGGGDGEEEGKEMKMKRGIEEYIPDGKGWKGLLARGINMLGYSLNSFRLSSIPFVDPVSPRRSQLIRLRLDSHQTANLVQGCESRGIKLCGALAAAGLMAARQCKHLPQGQWEKYSVVTLTDCRLLLQPPLPPSHPGFYHSAVLNSHDINGTELLWDLATRTYSSFRDAKNANKHFSDMADLNFLMCKAIDNPGLTPSSSLRTSFISVFEDPVIDQTQTDHAFEDYLGCASVHGVGPTLALFDTIRDGCLDCACMYPAPLHSTQQMQELVDHMKTFLVDL